MSRVIDLLGMRFGRLVVFGRGPSTAVNGFATWACRCDCGMVSVATGIDLRAGHTTSCGCLRREMLKAGLHVTDGKRRGRKTTPEYQAWISMKRRCYNPKDPSFEWYGGRSIRVDREWRRSFASFFRDVGERPSPQHSIDRIDNNGDYRPGNVRWATAKEQAANRRHRRDAKVAAPVIL